MESSFAAHDAEGTAAAPLDGRLRVEPEVGAALLLSGNYSRSLADRVFSALTPDEIGRLNRGLLRVKALPEERLSRLWERLTGLFTGDWREEEDLIEYIRATLRKGVREEPVLTPVQKLALLLLALPEAEAEGLSRLLLGALVRPAAAELTREMAHLLHYPGTALHERLVGEFQGFCAERSARGTGGLSLRVMEMEAEKAVRQDAASCAELMRQLWLREGCLLTRFQESVRQQPEKCAALMMDYAWQPAVARYLSRLERAAAFRLSLTREATAWLDEALQLEADSLPEPFPSAAQREQVLREFLHCYYVDYPEQIRIGLQ